MSTSPLCTQLPTHYLNKSINFNKGNNESKIEEEDMFLFEFEDKTQILTSKNALKKRSGFFKDFLEAYPLVREFHCKPYSISYPIMMMVVKFWNKQEVKIELRSVCDIIKMFLFFNSDKSIECVVKCIKKSFQDDEGELSVLNTLFLINLRHDIDIDGVLKVHLDDFVKTSCSNLHKKLLDNEDKDFELKALDYFKSKSIINDFMRFASQPVINNIKFLYMLYGHNKEAELLVEYMRGNILNTSLISEDIEWLMKHWITSSQNSIKIIMFEVCKIHFSRIILKKSKKRKSLDSLM